MPIAAEYAVGVAALSYDGTVFFGVIADRDTMPDLEVLVGAMRASVEELLSAARADGIVCKEGATRRSPPTRGSQGGCSQ